MIILFMVNFYPPMSYFISIFIVRKTMTKFNPADYQNLKKLNKDIIQTRYDAVVSLKNRRGAVIFTYGQNSHHGQLVYLRS